MVMMKTVYEGIKNPKKALEVLSYKVLSPAGSNEYTRFIVLSRSRTGSNLLTSLLNSHLRIKADGEIFSNLNGKNYKEVLAKAFSKQPYFVKAKGFKIFYYHPQDDHSCGIWDELQSMDDLYVIHLKRRNILRTLTSRKIAGIQDVWLSQADRYSNSRDEQNCISFTVDELNEGFRQTREWEDAGHNKFISHPLLSIYYEDLVNDPPAIFRELTEFLGVQYIHPKTELKKQNRRSMKETITNYDQLKSAFEGTEWAPFFED